MYLRKSSIPKSLDRFLAHITRITKDGTGSLHPDQDMHTHSDCLSWYLLHTLLESLWEGGVRRSPLGVLRLGVGTELVRIEVPVENHHPLGGLGVVDTWWDAHCKAVGLRLRFDGMGGHCGNWNGDCCVWSCEVASLVHAHLGRVWKDNIERHIFQNLDSVFSSRNERLFCHIWDAVPLRGKEKK